MPGQRGPRTAEHIALVLLAAASGAVDALAFTVLGHVFAGVMTGNLVLLGIAFASGRPADLAAPLVALAGFVAGTRAGALICRGAAPGARPGWPAQALFCLAGETAVLAAYATLWAGSGGAPGGLMRQVLLCVAAVAMGGQSAAMLVAGRAARPSTYFTGTLATYVASGAGAAVGAADRWVPVRLAALVAGAAVAAVLHHWAPAWAAVPAPVLVLAAVLGATYRPPRPARKTVPEHKG
ncbi:YoaK family protein [Streptomyces silvisoli]|uniref:YoaK family protein n=1 Tax=Streptomyces silvisoli TaxID=3034235 RepID=A0ABT5ZG19_9ACTN|nr:YoaK family protein [Streptomyces silvisoli]MDF3288772.1 YoaK family protein [Streptomyces silvisoli]